MMTYGETRIQPALRQAVEAATSGLVSSRESGDYVFVSLPIVYPDGSFVTVSVRQAPGGFEVSDNGFAHLELEAVGKHRSFTRVAKRIADDAEVEVGKRALRTLCDQTELQRAILDVGSASFRIVSDVFDDIEEQGEEAIAEAVEAKLRKVFDTSDIVFDADVTGASSDTWRVTAIVTDQNTSPVVFQSVANHRSSVYRAHTEFGDLRALDGPERRLIAVVKAREELVVSA